MRSRRPLARPLSFRNSSSKTSSGLGVSLRSFAHPTRPSPLFDRLDQYQKDAVEFVREAWLLGDGGAGLLFEQGTGKTWIAGAVIEWLYYGKFEGLVVVPLTNKVTTWFKLLDQYFDCYTDWDDYLEADAPKLFIAHYEQIPSLNKQLRKHHFSLICYDESQRLANRTSKQSKVAAWLGRRGEHRLILSGTPLEQHPKDLWAQMRFLVPHILGENWQAFVDRWFEPLKVDLRAAIKKYGARSGMYQRIFIKWLKEKRKQKFREDLLPEYLALLAPYCLRVTQAEVLDLPALAPPIQCPVTLLGSQRRLYEVLERDFVTELAGKRRITAGQKAVRIGKLQQITGGWIKDDDRNTSPVGRAKLRRVLRIVKHCDRPIVVCCRYVAEVLGVAEALGAKGLTGAMIYGKIKQKARIETQRKFQRGELDFIVVQQRTGGVGIDLFRSHVLILYSLTYSFIDYEQMIARLQRRGQEFPVEIYSVYAENTVDEDINLSITYKYKVVSQVLKGLSRRKHGPTL